MVRRADLYFVGDRENHIIHIFDDDGKHFRTISRRGRGPGEYLKISNFALDDELNVYVLCRETLQILKYVYPDYRYESSTELSNYISEIYWQGDILWAANHDNDYKVDGLVQMKGGDASRVILPFREKLDDSHREFFTKPRSFYPGAELLFNQRMSGDVYRLADGEAEKLFRIKSKYMVTAQNYAANDHNPFNYESICGFYNVFQSGNFIVGRLWTSSNLPPYDTFVYEPSTGRASFVRDAIGVAGLSGVTGDRFLALVNPSSLINSQHKDSLLEEVLPHITLDSNPIIVEFSVKKI